MHNSLNELAGRSKVYLVSNIICDDLFTFYQQVKGFKLSSLEHLSALKAYDGKTTLAQLMVLQVTQDLQLLRLNRALTFAQLGTQCRSSLLEDLSACTSAALINVPHLLETSGMLGVRVEQAVLFAYPEHSSSF